MKSETFTAWNTKRVSEGRSWQNLGEEFFTAWFNGVAQPPIVKPEIVAINSDEMNTKGPFPDSQTIGTISSEVVELLRQLLDIGEDALLRAQGIQGAIGNVGISKQVGRGSGSSDQVGLGGSTEEAADQAIAGLQDSDREMDEAREGSAQDPPEAKKHARGNKKGAA